MSLHCQCNLIIPEDHLTEEFYAGLCSVLGADRQDLIPEVLSDSRYEIFIPCCYNLSDLRTFLCEQSVSLTEDYFSLECTGEEFGMHFMYYFRNGKLQEEKAQFMPFDSAKLVSEL